jgi:glycosyltransferase involved in cell wall biosynthesis
VRAASATIVDGSVDRRVLRLVSGHPSIHCVTNGVEMRSPTPPAARASAPTVVLTGSLAYSANIDAAVWFAREVWPQIRAVLPTSRFVLAGRDPSAEILALRSVSGIEVLGNVPDMSSVLRDAWIAIAPVRTGSGIRTKILEAWAAGTPVLLSRVAATGLTLDADAASLVANGARQTTKILLEVLQNASLRERLGASAHALASREYAGWQRPAHRVSELLEQAARSS